LEERTLWLLLLLKGWRVRRELLPPRLLRLEQRVLLLLEGRPLRLLLLLEGSPLWLLLLLEGLWLLRLLLKG